MPVRKRPGRSWEVRVSLGGRRIERRLPAGATRDDAYELEAQIRRELVDLSLGRREPSLAEVLNRYEADARSLKSWGRDLRYRLEAIRNAYGARKIGEATTIAEELKTAAVVAGKRPAAVNRYLAILRRAANIAKAEHSITMVPGEVRRTQRANLSQLRKLLIASDPRLRPMIEFAVYTGMRRGEQLSLQPEQIRDRHAVLPDTKPGLPRVVPLSPNALRIAGRCLPWALKRENVRRLFDLARAAAGMPWLRWHDLRRTFGSLAMRHGATLMDVRDLLGHADVKTTSIYLAAERAELERAVRRMPTIGGDLVGTAKKRGRRAA